MFEYFPGNYPWTLAVVMAVGSGAELSEVDEACRPLKDLKPGPEATDKFFDAWLQLAQRVEGLARADEAAGHRLSAGRKYQRAAAYYFTCERVHRIGSLERKAAYAKLLECFGKFVSCRSENCERVEIPFQGEVMPALLTRAKGKAPLMIHFDGLDGTKELLYLNGISSELARRGVSTLIVDHPGVGEALRLHDMHGFPEIELAAGAAFDFAAKLDGVDASRIGIMAVSLGGYYAPRSAALDPRFACCVAWGAVYDWGKIQRGRFSGSGTQRSVPHFAEHLKWVIGKDDLEECLRVTDKFSLEGLLDRIRCPILIVHGENDRQIPVAEAKKVYEACVNSKRRDLKVFTPADGGIEHCSVDNFSVAVDYMVDWVGEVMGGDAK
jgi:dienelactone hydrolase